MKKINKCSLHRITSKKNNDQNCSSFCARMGLRPQTKIEKEKYNPYSVVP